MRTNEEKRFGASIVLLTSIVYFVSYFARKDFAANIEVQKEFQSFVFRCYENHAMTWKEYVKDWDIFKWKKFMERVITDESIEV